MNATLPTPTPARSPAGLGAGSFDEAAGSTQLQAVYATLFERLDGPALAAAAEGIRATLSRRGVVFGGSQRRPYHVDAVPRLIAREEWARVEAGLAQRIRALNAFLEDAYGERRIIAAGAMPARVIDEADWFEPAMLDAAGEGRAGVRAHVAGPDLVRGPAGELRILEDNLRAPSGLTFAIAAREALRPLIEASGLHPRPLDSWLSALERTLVGAAAPGVDDPRIVLLSDGPGAGTFYEHAEICRVLGLALATPADLRRDGDRLLLENDGDAPVDVIYRRVDDERLTRPDGRPTPLGDLLIEPLRAGTLAVANSPGSGIGDDKAVHTYVERMIGFYLDEAPLLRSVPGYDLGDPDQLAEALPRLAELVIKPRSHFGGSGVVIGPLAGAEERQRAIELVREAPNRWVAQEPVPLSVHPTLVDGRLQSRHVDLRPFVLSSAEETFVVPAGLTRFARDEGDMVVNSGQGGGAKDTWIL